MDGDNITMYMAIRLAGVRSGTVKKGVLALNWAYDNLLLQKWRDAVHNGQHGYAQSPFFSQLIWNEPEHEHTSTRGAAIGKVKTQIFGSDEKFNVYGRERSPGVVVYPFRQRINVLYIIH